MIKFSIENEQLFVLDTKHGRRSAYAAIKIATDMVDENLITEREAILHLNGAQITHFLFPTIDPHYGNSTNSVW